MQDSLGWAPISQLVGLEVQPGIAGEAEVFLNVDQRMHNPMGFVHGGVIALLADAAMGIAFGRTLDDQHGFATVELKTSFIRPATQTRLLARAKLIQRGLRIGFVECVVTDQRGKLIATASCTCTVNSLGSATPGLSSPNPHSSNS
ncbi:MAG: PaaI family thioesterase [Pirellulaceae bacterium]